MSDSYPPGLDPLFGTAVRRILQGEALEPFCDWFSQEMGALMQSQLPVPRGEEADALRYRRHVARALWQAVPVPSNRWRPRPLAKTERNSPCHCGSGRKYKQCCAQFGSVPLPADAGEMLILALSHAEPAMLQPRQLREVPAEALGVAAQAWNKEDPARTVAVLEPLFERVEGLDWRHALAFEALMDALLELGQENRRQALAQRVAGSRDRELGCTASGRLISMLADRGEEQAAWAMFQEAQRKYPDDPALWSLELTLLHAQGRGDEARMRGSMLAAMARRAGLDEAADQLAQLGEQGFAMAFEPRDDELDVDDELAAWIELCEQVPQRVDEEDCRKLYRVERQAGLPGEPPALRIRPDRKLAGVERQWRRRFGAGKPMLTQLQGDASAQLDALPEAARFLQEQPAAWHSIEVLDDLLLAAADLCATDVPVAALQGAKRLASHAVAVLHALVGARPARLEWADVDSRAALRVLAQAIALAQQMLDAPAVEQLAGWALELNPNDNHGWRMVLAPQLAGQGRFEEALALMQRYPDDMPPMEHLRSLALFALGRRDEAEQVLRKTHAQYPRIMEYLLPEVVDAPPAEAGPGIAVGGAGEAWENRMHTRAAWVRTGALEWARALDLKAAPPAAREATTKKKKKNEAAKSAGLDTYDGRDESALRKSFPDYVRLHGFMTAVAWSPDLLQPMQWLQALLALRTEPAAELGTLNADLEALLRLYNSLTTRVMAAANDGTPPITDAMTLAGSSDADAFAWAAGFVQGAEAGRAGWRRAGRPVSSDNGAFAALLRLAARAPGAAGGWRALDDDGQPMLQGLQDAPSPQETLRLALEDLWRAIAPLRREGAT